MLQDELRDIARMLKVPMVKLIREMKLENTPLAAAASVPEPPPVDPPEDPVADSNAAA